MRNTSSISESSRSLTLDAPSPSRIRQRKATGGGVLKLRPKASVESLAARPDLTERMQAVGHNRAVETANWLDDRGLLTDSDKRALAALPAAEVKGLLTVSKYFGNRVWNRSDRDNVRRAVLLCAARNGVDKAMQLKQDLLAKHRIGGSDVRGLSLLDAADATSFAAKPLRDRLDTMVVDATVSQRLETTSGHRRAQETFDWLRNARLANDEPLLDTHDKAALYKLPPEQLDALLTVSKSKDHVPDLADRQNIRRAVMVCAAKHGVEAAQDLKQRLLAGYRAEPAAVRGFEALDPGDAESFEPGVLDERLAGLRLDQDVFEHLDEPEARSSYAWLSQQNLLDNDERENLAGILAPKDLSDIALDEPGIGDLLKLDNSIQNPVDRRNVKRALLLCAAKEGMPAARRLKQGLLAEGNLNFDRVGVQLRDVPAYMQLRTPWAKSDGATGGPTGLWQQLADGRSGGAVDPNALSHGAVDEQLAALQDEAADRELLFAQQKEKLGTIVETFDRQLDPNLAPQERLEALKQVIDIAADPAFLVKLDNALPDRRISEQSLVSGVTSALGHRRFALQPALRDVLSKAALGQRGMLNAMTGQALKTIAQIPPGGDLSSDMALHLNNSRKWGRALSDLESYDPQTIQGTMKPLRERMQALTTNVTPPSAPLGRPDAQVRFAPDVKGTVFDKDNPVGDGAPEQDLTARQLAALRGTCMMLQFAKELNALPPRLGGNQLDAAVSNTLRATQNLQTMTIDELQARVKELS